MQIICKLQINITCVGSNVRMCKKSTRTSSQRVCLVSFTNVKLVGMTIIGVIFEAELLLLAFFYINVGFFNFSSPKKEYLKRDVCSIDIV